MLISGPNRYEFGRYQLHANARFNADSSPNLHTQKQDARHGFYIEIVNDYQLFFAAGEVSRK
jgi:hypothetical protein